MDTGTTAAMVVPSFYAYEINLIIGGTYDQNSGLVRERLNIWKLYLKFGYKIIGV